MAPHENKYGHPTPKPLALYRRILDVAGKSRGMLLELFAGSGPGAIAAMRWGMESFSIEQRPDYCDMIRQRILDEWERPDDAPDDDDTGEVALEEDTHDDDMLSEKRYWLTPPSLTALLEWLFPDGWWDACPYPRPKGFDSLAVKRWPAKKSPYVNAPFTKKDEVGGRGLSAWADKFVEQHQLSGTTGAMVMPVTDAVNKLLAAGAEAIPLGRLPWLDVDSGEPWPNPGASTLFILDSADPAK